VTMFKESEVLELKKSTSELKEGVISIVSMLNKHGKGELYFGIKNDGTVVGQDISENTLRDVSQSIAENIDPKIYPEIKEISIENKSCVVVRFEGSDIPYFAFGRAYIRVADEDRKLSAKELENIILKKNIERTRWDNRESDYSLTDINEEALKKYIKKGNETGRISFDFQGVEITLKKLNLMKDNKLLKAAEVLFCDENLLETQLAVFAGTEKITFLDIQQFKDNIFSLLGRTENYIKEHINWRVKFGELRRKEIPEIPIEAVREALVNSFCHRDYLKPESNKIAIFKNRIEIYNPGTFPEGLTPEDYIKGEEQSILRNPLIAETLYKSKEIEKWGSGIKRIYDQCRAEGVDVEFKMLKSGFMIVFYRPPIDDRVWKTWDKTDEEIPGKTVAKTPNTVEKTVVKPGKTVEKIISAILENPAVSTSVLAEKTGLTRRGIEWNIKNLKNKGILKRNGPAKGGHWEIAFNKNNY
jgi:ATP-dependent DNA helicase RecG